MAVVYCALISQKLYFEGSQNYAEADCLVVPARQENRA